MPPRKKAKIGFAKESVDGPSVAKRDENGLLDGVKHIFGEDGLIDWRKMVKDKYLYPNPSKNLSETDVSKLSDNDLCILLGGLKELAQIRGYSNIKYDVSTPSSDYVVATCSITWIPNYETEGREVTFSSVGDASLENSSPVFGVYYLATSAENRAFVRCVRNFLRINIVSKEEIGSNPNKGSGTEKNIQEKMIGPWPYLSELLKEKDISFDKVKSQLEKENFDGTEKLNSIYDIPKLKCMEIIDRIKNKSKS
jgi:hypothetical protein